MQSGQEEKLTIDQLINLGKKYRRAGDQPNAQQHYLKALSQTKDLSARAYIEKELGDSYRDEGNKEKSKEYYLLAVPNLREVDKLIVNGNIKHLFKNYNEARALYQEALKQRMNDSDKANLLQKIGDVYRDEQNFSEAIKYYQDNLLISTDELNQASAFRKLGFIYQEIGNYSEAESYYTKALEIKKRYASQNPMAIVNISNCLGSLYCYLNQPDKAVAMFEQSTKIIQEHYKESHNRYQIFAFKWKARAECLRGQYEKAKALLDEVQKLENDTVDPIDKAQTLYHLALYYQALENYNEAKKYLQEALTIFNKIYPETHHRIKELNSVMKLILKEEPKIIISVGLPGVGKRILFNKLAKKMQSPIFFKDTAAEAMLPPGEKYFTAYYDNHVRKPAYDVPCAHALDNLKLGMSAFLHGYYGPRLIEVYEYFKSKGFTVKIIVADCPADMEFNQLLERNAVRDKDKVQNFESFLSFRQKELEKHMKILTKFEGYCSIPTGKDNNLDQSVAIALDYIYSSSELKPSENYEKEVECKLTSDQIKSGITMFDLLPLKAVIENKNIDQQKDKAVSGKLLSTLSVFANEFKQSSIPKKLEVSPSAPSSNLEMKSKM